MPRASRSQSVDADADLADYDLLIVGKAALTVDGPAPDITRVRDGLRVVVFEQTSDVLEKRFGFRVAEYGLRQVFPRVPDHPLLAGLDQEHLRDWRGSATILPPQLEYEMRPRHGPTVRWCDIEVPRLWRCGNRGNVASVLIEKPARGDFLPIVDGGFSLQYSPLMEYREGRGMILFCQMDVTGAPKPIPAAETLVGNLLAYVSSWKPAPSRTAVYVGEEAGRQHLASAGFRLEPYAGTITAEQVLVVGPGGGKTLARDAAAIADWLKAGGNLLAIGLDQQDLDFLPSKVGIRKTRAHRRLLRTIPGRFTIQWSRPRGRSQSRSSPVAADRLGSDDRRRRRAGSRGRPERTSSSASWPPGSSTAKQWNLKKTYRRSSFLVTRLLANLGAATSTPIIDRFHVPVAAEIPPRWQTGLYLDQPEEWDDPYRFFRW